MAQRPPSLTDRRKAAQTNSTGAMRWRFQGVEYALDMQHLEMALERELFQQANITAAQARQALIGGAPFGLAALTYLARRQAGERITYAMLEADMDRQLQAMAAAGELPDLEWLGDDDDGQGDDAGPPSPGASSAA